MKYQLINNQTKEKHLCDKVTVDGFDYYVSEDKPKENDWCIKEQQYYGKSLNKAISYSDLNSTTAIWKKIIATTNPNIDIPQVVDEVETLAREATKIYINEREKQTVYLEFMNGYNKSKETHPFSEEDIIEFLNWVRDNCVFDSAPKPYYRKTQERLTQKELLQLWKSQQPQKIYYKQTTAK